MDLYQTEPNSVYYTKDQLCCYICRKKHDKVIEVFDKGMYCYGCFYKNITHDVFGRHDTISTRLLISVGNTKKKRKSERNKMTNSLRYDIMNRDNFCCVLCGNTSKDDKLVIDHINPIINGGKTVKSNLQTLCHTCNSGKAGKVKN